MDVAVAESKFGLFSFASFPNIYIKVKYCVFESIEMKWNGKWLQRCARINYMKDTRHFNKWIAMWYGVVWYGCALLQYIYSIYIYRYQYMHVEDTSLWINNIKRRLSTVIGQQSDQINGMQHIMDFVRLLKTSKHTIRSRIVWIKIHKYFLILKIYFLFLKWHQVHI